MLKVKGFKMAPILLLLLIVMPVHSICQQHHFILKVHIDGLSAKTLGIGEAYWSSLQSLHAAKMKSDSCYSDDNIFMFEGTTLYPTAIRIYPLDKSKYFNKLIFIDTGYQEINLTKNDSSITIKANTPVEIEHGKFINAMGVKTLDDSINGKKLLKYVKDTPDSYVALFAIINQVYNYPSQEIFDKINKAFGDKIKQTKAFQFYVNTFSPKPLAKTDPNLLGTSIDGKRITLSSFKDNDFVLLDFWATWCKPCLELTPSLKKIYQKYHSKGLQIISISSSLADKKDIWRKTVKRENMQSWINIFSEKSDSAGRDLAIKYGVTQIPTIILINKKGDIIDRWVGFSKEDMVSKLNEKLSKLIK
jgi:thiol-disulfide isomerase/thioredoxin